MVNPPCSSQPFPKAGDGGVAVSTLLLRVPALQLRRDSSHSLPVHQPGWSWMEVGVGTPGYHASHPCWWPCSISGSCVLHPEHRPRRVPAVPPGTSTPRGPCPHPGVQPPRRGSPAGLLVIACFVSPAAGRGPRSGDEGDLPFPVVVGGRPVALDPPLSASFSAVLPPSPPAFGASAPGLLGGVLAGLRA